MKTISSLKKLINIYYYILVIGFIVFTIVLPVLFSLDKLKYLYFIKEYDLSKLSLMSFLSIILVSSVIYFLFLKAIYLLKKSLEDLTDENYFSGIVIKNFNRAGRLILIVGICNTIFKFLLQFILMDKVEFGVNNSLILSIIIGLFLMFLSEVFEKGRKTQQENDLTI